MARRAANGQLPQPPVTPPVTHEPAATDQGPPEPSSPTETKPEPFRAWICQPKPTEWIAAFATCCGLAVVWTSGIFDAKKAETAAVNERLKVEQLHLETRREKLSEEIALKNSELEEVIAKLRPMEEERAAFEQIAALRRRSDRSMDFALRPEIGIILSDSLDSWRLEIRRRLQSDANPGVIWSASGIEPGGHDVKPIHDEVIPAVLEAATRIDRLQDVSISDYRVTGESLDLLSRCRNLDHLTLVNCGVDDVALSRLKSMNRLTVLYLGHNEIASPPELAGMERVTKLYLHSNPITDGGLPNLTRSFPGLKVLDLEGTRVTDACVPSLLALDDLRVVHLRRTSINSRALIQLLNLPRIVAVHIEKDRIEPATKHRFDGRIPPVFLGEMPEPAFVVNPAPPPPLPTPMPVAVPVEPRVLPSPVKPAP